MPIRPVLRFPHGALKSPSSDITAIDEDALSLAQDLIDTMRSADHCVGLAAPQIGINIRAFALNVRGHPKALSDHGEFVLFNPRIIEGYDAVEGREGCMSVPDLTGDVMRWSRVTVAGMAIDGSQMTLEADAFEARAIQHEVDHLDGLLFLDRVASREALFRRRTYR
ncbi:MAG TPA: peptide deformylase [Actinomycetota bacterium]|nr:peptide deformylase [Actinomycetota bacterium]